MKQIIKDVLMDIADSQPNLHSEAARENIATSIISVIKTKGTYTKYTDTEINEQKARESWVCKICGESTFEVEYDYIGTGTNHLGCELEIELKDWDPTQGDKRVTNDRRKHDRREKSWYQKKHDQSDVVAKALGHMDEEGNFITQTEEVDGIYTDDEVKDWEEAVGYVEDIDEQAHAQGRESSYDEDIPEGLKRAKELSHAILESHKLAEEIVDNKDKWIYESPDGGETTFRRPYGDYDIKNKVEIDWETKEPTGRVFTDYPFD